MEGWDQEQCEGSAVVLLERGGGDEKEKEEEEEEEGTRRGGSPSPPFLPLLLLCCGVAWLLLYLLPFPFVFIKNPRSRPVRPSVPSFLCRGFHHRSPIGVHSARFAILVSPHLL
jgi:hypothetical protein